MAKVSTIFCVSVLSLLLIFEMCAGGDLDNDVDASETELSDINFDENQCSLDAHTIIDSLTTCCNHTIILKHGIDFGKYWKECAVRQTNGVAKGSKQTKDKGTTETFIDSSRRVYACILEKYHKKASISMVDFARLMSSSYPPKIKSMIMNQAKNYSSQQKQKTISIKNYQKLRGLRVDYFKIQKNICMTLDPTSEMPILDMNEIESSNSTCVLWEEAERNGGNCCQDQSVPFDLDYWHVRPETYSCNTSLKDLFKKWMIEESQLDVALEICADACKLKEQGVLTSDSLDKMQIRTKKELVEQIYKIAPPYLSQSVLGNLQNYSFSHNGTSGLEAHYIEAYHLTKNITTKLLPCIFVRRLTEIIYDGLYAHCFPQTSKGPKVEQ